MGTALTDTDIVGQLYDQDSGPTPSVSACSATSCRSRPASPTGRTSRCAPTSRRTRRDLLYFHSTSSPSASRWPDPTSPRDLRAGDVQLSAGHRRRRDVGVRSGQVHAADGRPPGPVGTQQDVGRSTAEGRVPDERQALPARPVPQPTGRRLPTARTGTADRATIGSRRRRGTSACRRRVVLQGACSAPSPACWRSASCSSTAPPGSSTSRTAPWAASPPPSASRSTSVAAGRGRWVLVRVARRRGQRRRASSAS